MTIDYPIDKVYLQQFLEKNHLGILSTVNIHNTPHAAPIYFIPHAKSILYFITPRDSQKIQNISTNNNVVLTVLSTDLTESVQITGTAHVTNDTATKTLGELARTLNYGEDFLTTLPVLKYENQEKVVVKIIPSSIRLRRYTQYSFIDRTFELNPTQDQ